MPDETGEARQTRSLRRDLGVFGATMLGLGSIVGTGVFVSIGIAAGIAGPAVVIAIAVAAVLATCNALSSAQLAANHPVSGGTYEYGYLLLTPQLGFTAGWMFLCAKSASAATAALGFSGYLLHALGLPAGGRLVPIALTAVLVLTVTVLAGIRRASWANVLIVSVTLLALVAFVALGAPQVAAKTEHLWPPFRGDGETGFDHLAALLHASALMFVAYTGYGRIATLGEEVHEPRRTIPRAIVTTLIVSALLYIAVAVVGVATLGAAGLSEATSGEAAPLEIAAEQFAWPQTRWVVAVGAMTAMLGVLLNLILGLSRVLLAMGRRGDVPRQLRAVAASGTPVVAVVVVGMLIAGLAAIGSVKTTWSFSAFTVLIYYALTNLAALRLRPEQRLFSRLFAWGGLFGCVLLAFWVEWRVWLVGLGLIGAGLLWQAGAARLTRPS
jgi:APA family basic amino acid/polyamine antiporter